MEKQKIPEGKISEAKWESSWKESFMNYKDKKQIVSNTLSDNLIGK